MHPVRPCPVHTVSTEVLLDTLARTPSFKTGGGQKVRLPAGMQNFSLREQSFSITVYFPPRKAIYKVKKRSLQSPFQSISAAA